MFSDWIQVKQQKPRRPRSGAKPVEEVQRDRVRVNTDVWMVERASGGFRYLTGGVNESGEEIVSVESRVQQCLQSEYGGRASALPVVAITDGAKAIRCQLTTIFGQPIPVILDWYHLEKKVCELMSSAARNKTEKEKHASELLKLLWRGRTKEAVVYLQTQVEARSEKWLEALQTYLEKHESEIIDYERRQKAGKSIGSGRMEKVLTSHRRSAEKQRNELESDRQQSSWNSQGG